jgi:hypothetical protein
LQNAVNLDLFSFSKHSCNNLEKNYNIKNNRIFKMSIFMQFTSNFLKIK